jgi:hypothetical protein
VKHPKSKGDAYERALAAHFNAHLDKAVRLADFKRAALSGGGFSDSGFDLTNTEITLDDGRTRFSLGIEAKRTERLSLWEAWRQAQRHAENALRANPNHPPIVPMVITRRNLIPVGASLAVLALDDFIALLNAAAASGRRPPSPQTQNGGPKPPVSTPPTYDFTRPLEQELPA